MKQDLILKKREGLFAFIIFNRPEKLNSLNFQMLQMIPGLMKEIEQEEELRIIIFRGSGNRAFSSGGDITEFKEYSQSRDKAEEFHGVLLEAIESVYNMKIPTIAMVNGPAVGAGCEIAMACDIRIASEDALFGITGSRLGFPIPYRNALRLVSLIGPANAKKMLFTGELVPARDAFRMGLTTLVVSGTELESRTFKLASDIAANAPLAQIAIKRTINQVVHDPALATVKDRSLWFVEAFLSDDFKEGVDAFLEKRPPGFKGK